MHYNWSQLTRASLYEMLHKAGKDVIGKTLTPKEFKARITAGLSHLPVRIRVIKHVISESKIVYIGGCYYPTDDEAGKTPIEIHFHYYPMDRVIALSAAKWRRVCMLFADTMLHEIIHMKQFRSKNFVGAADYQSTSPIKEQKKLQSYYGNPDEIEAFAFNIACELYAKFGSKEKVIECVNSNNLLHGKRGTALTYLVTFDFDFEHPVIKKLKKMILKSLDGAIRGKPFKASKYLTH